MRGPSVRLLFGRGLHSMSWKSRLGALLLVALVIAGILFGTGYWLADSAYTRLLSEKPSTRGEVLTALSGFQEQPITHPEKMQPVLRDRAVTVKELKYYRYTNFLGFSIDVVYDSEYRVYATWPEYE